MERHSILLSKHSVLRVPGGHFLGEGGEKVLGSL